MRVTDFLDRGAARYADRYIFHAGETGITYRELQAMTHKIANAVLGAGMGVDSKIATFSPNHPLVVAAQYGIIRAGAIWMPINVRNGIEENIEILNMLDADWLLFHSSFAGDIEKVRASCPNIKGFVCLDQQSEHGLSLDEWIADQPSVAPDIWRGPDDVYAILTTSGTTGRPKGVMLSHLNFEAQTASFDATMPFDEPPVHLVAAPLTHAAGFLAGALLAKGATHILLPKPDPGVILQWIEKFKVSTLFLPPTLIYMLLSHPEADQHDYSSLRYVVYGAAPMSAEKLKEATRIFGPVFFQIFAQTEAPMMITSMTPRDHLEALEDPAKQRRLYSCGRPGPFTTVGVMDDEGNLLPPGRPGEIVCRGNIVMKGYYKNPIATEEVSAYGWHHTGDVGQFDEDGFLYLVDRKKDMIISGGFNVYPSEVEQVIWTHPAVQDCAVVGVPDDKWGEAVTAVVELKPGATLDANELIAMCKRMLGSVKTPKAIHVWPALPRSSVGKVLKREIRKTFWEGHERMIN